MGHYPRQTHGDDSRRAGEVDFAATAPHRAYTEVHLKQSPFLTLNTEEEKLCQEIMAELQEEDTRLESIRLILRRNLGGYSVHPDFDIEFESCAEKIIKSYQGIESTISGPEGKEEIGEKMIRAYLSWIEQNLIEFILSLRPQVHAALLKESSARHLH